MPILNRRQPSLDLRKTANARDSTDSNQSSKERLWWASDELERPTKDVHYSSTKLSKKSVNNLRLKTEPELHDHYQSSEESASPSPDDYQSDSNDDSILENDNRDEKEDEKQGDLKDDIVDPSSSVYDFLDTSFPTIYSIVDATSIKVIHVGRPKLVTITNSAVPVPPQKRIQRPASTRLAAHKRLTSLDENMPYPGPSSSISTQSYTTAPSPSVIPAHNQSLRRMPSHPQPDTWLPESVSSPTESISDHYFPDHSPDRTSYEDYDPYHLDPPHLQRDSSSLRNSSSSLSYFYQGHSRNQSQASLGVPQATKNKGAERWRGIARGLGRTKATKGKAKTEVKTEAKAKAAKASNRMVARGADEREESLVLPPFPFEGVIV